MKELLKKILADMIEKKSLIKLAAGILIGVAASYLGLAESELKDLICDKPASAEQPAP